MVKTLLTLVLILGMVAVACEGQEWYEEETLPLEATLDAWYEADERTRLATAGFITNTLLFKEVDRDEWKEMSDKGVEATGGRFSPLAVFRERSEDMQNRIDRFAKGYFGDGKDIDNPVIAESADPIKSVAALCSVALNWP